MLSASTARVQSVPIFHSDGDDELTALIALLINNRIRATDFLASPHISQIYCGGANEVHSSVLPRRLDKINCIIKHLDDQLLSFHILLELSRIIALESLHTFKNGIFTLANS